MRGDRYVPAFARRAERKASYVRPWHSRAPLESPTTTTGEAKSASVRKCTKTVPFKISPNFSGVQPSGPNFHLSRALIYIIETSSKLQHLNYYTLERRNLRIAAVSPGNCVLPIIWFQGCLNITGMLRLGGYSNLLILFLFARQHRIPKPWEEAATATQRKNVDLLSY